MIGIERKPREWYPGATYHLMERGVRQMEIFKKEIDYHLFLSILKRTTEQYHAQVHAYCFMTTKWRKNYGRHSQT